MAKDQYNHDDRLSRIEKIVTDIDKKLFRGNGSPPWDVRLDRVERLSKVLVWLGALMASTTFVVAGKFVYDHLLR